MFRRSFTVFLVLFLAFPRGAFPSDKDASREQSTGVGGSFLWGALSLLNGTILVSSIGDLRFYESRADEVDAAGGDAGAYWDASSREKLVIGISALSLLFSLAGLKQSFERPARVEEVPIAAPPPRALPTPPGPVQVLTLESRVRYDTLFTQPAAPLPAEPVVSETRRAEEAPAGPGAEPDVGDDRVASILLGLEQGPPAPGEDQTPAADSSPPAPDVRATAPPARVVSEPRPARVASQEDGEAATFTLLPYGVHVTSFRTLAEAEKDEAKWRKRGEQVSIEEDEVPGKGIWFRVLLGNFATVEEARAFADTVKERHGLDYAQARRRAGF